MDLSRELNWRFFDITSGRANRLQFLIYLMFFLVISFVTGYYYLAYYMLLVGIFKRYRDSGIGNWLGIALVVINILPLLMFMIPLGQTIIVMSYYFASFSDNSFPSFGLLISLIFIIPLFSASDPYPNAYGYPPIGLDIRTMHRSTYSEALISKYKVEEKARMQKFESKYEEKRSRQYSHSIKKENGSTTEHSGDILSVEVKPRN